MAGSYPDAELTQQSSAGITLDSARTTVRKRASFTVGTTSSAEGLRNAALNRRDAMTAPCHSIAARKMKKIKTAMISMLGASREC